MLVRAPSAEQDVAEGAQGCFRRIDTSEAVLVVDPEAYAGVSVLPDIGYAYARGKQIYLRAPHADPAVMGLATVVTA